MVYKDIAGHQDCFRHFSGMPWFNGTFRCASMACHRSQSCCRFSQNPGQVLIASPSAIAESAPTCRRPLITSLRRA